MSGVSKNWFTSEYFTLKELAKGVYAAIENKAADAKSNAGFVDMGDYTIVFDAFLNIEAAKDLKRASEEMTGRKPAILVNSHYHADHVVGNCMFGKETRVITSKSVSEKMHTDSLKTIQEFQSNGAKILDELKAQISIETDAFKLMDLKNDYSFIYCIAMPGVQLRMPDITFENKLSFYGESRKTELVSFEIAHSPGDVIMYLPEDKICFAGDVLFKDSHPWLGTGNPEKFVGVLEELLKLDAEVFVTGHGDLANKNDIKLELKYIKELLALVEARKSKGEGADTITLEDMSEEFRSWDGLCFPWNVNFLFKR